MTSEVSHHGLRITSSAAKSALRVTYDRSLLFSSSRRCPVERRSSSTPTPPRTAVPDRWHVPSSSHTYTCRRRIGSGNRTDRPSKCTGWRRTQDQTGNCTATWSLQPTPRHKVMYLVYGRWSVIAGHRWSSIKSSWVTCTSKVFLSYESIRTKFVTGQLTVLGDG